MFLFKKYCSVRTRKL